MDGVGDSRTPGAPAAVRPEEVAQDRLLEALRKATLGEFEIYQELGRGGMARVYLGYDIALDRHVAIKVMSPALMLEEGMAERFRREARIAANLSHPNIVPVYTVRQTEDLAYFVMKYVDGCTLDFLITEHAPLPFDLARHVLVELCEALGFAHERGIVHRDIKPGNILISSDGRVIITDFGIARAKSLSGLTSTGASVGTPYYMSPEQWSAGEVTGQSDQYSLGVVLFQMLTGELPFRGLGPAEVMQAHILEPPPNIRALRRDCPADLARVVERMLAKKPTERWPSLEHVLVEVRGHTDPPEVSRNRLKVLAQTAPPSPSLPRPPTSPAPSSRAGVAIPRHPVNDGRRHARWVKLAIGGGAILTLAIGVFLLTTWAGNNRQLQSPGVDSGVAQLGPRAPVPNAPNDSSGVASTATNPQPGTTLTEPPRKRPTNRGPRRPGVAGDEASDPKSGAPTEGPSTPDTQPTPPPPAAEAEWAWVKFGSLHPNAILYINGQRQPTPAPALQTWQVRPGEVKLELGADYCTRWDTTITVAAGKTASIGRRAPRDCTR